ncbi:MAG: hypothetical protein OHK0046_34750 [Anaerolineae bacterium]
MQQVTTPHEETLPTNGAVTGGFVITVETLAVAVLVVIAVLIRFLALGGVPLTETETAQALSAWRDVAPEAPGETLVSESPVLYWTQVLTFGMAGGSEFAARFFTALAGVLLALTPLLFRRLLGVGRAYLFALLLTLSPVMVTASRLGAGATWAMLFAALALWAFWRYWESNRNGYAVAAVVAFAALMLLAEPGGVVLALVLLVAGLIAGYLTILDAPNKRDIPGNEALLEIRARLLMVPWATGAAVAAVVVIGISTAFLLAPNGLSSVAAVLGGFWQGISDSREGAPLFFPLVVSLFYELWVWIFAIVAVVMLVRRGTATFQDRFLLGWIIAAAFASVLYQGGEAAHALWLIVPLTGLASFVLVDALDTSDTETLWLDDNGGRLGKWVLMVLMLGLLVMMAVHFQVISRALLNVNTVGDFFNQVRVCLIPTSEAACPASQFPLRNSVIWFIVTVLFLVIGSLMAASVWGNTTTGRGALLGLFAFGLLTSLSTGWNISVSNADDPVELWYIRAPAEDAGLLRQTLLELADRETQGFPKVPVAVVAPQDGLIAWLLRDFTNVRYVESVAEARGEQVVIAPATALPEDVENPDINLGGSYVGQRLVIERGWDVASLQGADFIPWWAVREVRDVPFTEQFYILWVRQDIFESQPFFS